MSLLPVPAAPLPPPLPIQRASELPAGTLALLLAGVGVLGTAVALGELDALFVTVSLLACIFVLLDFRLGATLLILLMPVSASTVFPHSIGGLTGLNPLNLLLLGTLTAALAHRARYQAPGRLIPRGLVWRYLLPMAVAALIGVGHVGDIPEYFADQRLVSFTDGAGYLRDMLIKPMFLVLFALLVSAAFARDGRFERFLLPMLASVWIMGLLSLGFVFLSGASLGELASARSRAFLSPLGMHANDLGRCYAVAYALMLFTFAATRTLRWRLLLGATMGMLVLALLLTFSRGAFLGFLVVNLIFLVSRRNLIALIGGTLMLAGLILVLPGAVFARIGLGWDADWDAITAGRLDGIWLPLLPTLESAPLLGHGLGSILWSLPMRAGGMLEVTHPHNAYLQLALDLGLIGGLLVFGYVMHLWRGFRALARDTALAPMRRGFYEGAAAGLLAFLIAGFAGSSFLPVAEQSFLWLAVGMMYGEHLRRAGGER